MQKCPDSVIGVWALALLGRRCNRDRLLLLERVFQLVAAVAQRQEIPTVVGRPHFLHVSAKSCGIAASFAPTGRRSRVASAFLPDVKPRFRGFVIACAFKVLPKHS